MRNKRNSESDAEGAGSEINLDDEVDALFRLPLPEFINARNDLAARLKRGRRSDHANLVKALAKPPVSAWAVNQLYWNHREEFDRLLAAGRRVRQAQASSAGGDVSDMRGSIEARREALSRLSELAAALLRDAGHNPAPDILHRITTTLEAVSAYDSLPDGQTLGRLTRDLDPPGFDSLASLLAVAGATKIADATATKVNDTTKPNEEPVRVAPSQESGSAAAATRQEASAAGDVQNAHLLEDPRQAGIAAAKVSLQNADRALTEAKARAQQLEAAQQKANEQAEQAARELRELEERLKKAVAAARDAAERSQSIAAEAKEAAEAVEDAERNVEKASKELESLLRESASEWPK